MKRFPIRLQAPIYLRIKNEKSKNELNKLRANLKTLRKNQFY